MNDTKDATRSNEIDAALETAAACREEARIWSQLKFAPHYVQWLRENAKAAERWAAKR